MDDGGRGATCSEITEPTAGFGDVLLGAGDTSPSVEVGEVLCDVGGGGLWDPRGMSSSSLSYIGIMGDPGLIRSSSSSSSA